MMKISNVTFDEIAIGDTATCTRLITNQEVEAFAAISGDHNPLHLDPEYAATTAFGECIVCFDASCDTALGCGHLQVCQGCAATLESCPTCRTAITLKLRVFA